MDLYELIGKITIKLMSRNMSILWAKDTFLLQNFKHHTTMNHYSSKELKSINDLCAEFYHGTDDIIMQILQTPNGTIHIFYDFL